MLTEAVIIILIVLVLANIIMAIMNKSNRKKEYSVEEYLNCARKMPKGISSKLQTITDYKPSKSPVENAMIKSINEKPVRDQDQYFNKKTYEDKKEISAIKAMNKELGISPTYEEEERCRTVTEHKGNVVTFETEFEGLTAKNIKPVAVKNASPSQMMKDTSRDGYH